MSVEEPGDKDAFNPEETPDAAAPQEFSSEPEVIPVEPSQRSVGGSSLLDEPEEDVCPSCGVEMPNADAVVCTHCGYDLVANRTIKPVIGEVAPVVVEASEPFSHVTKFGWKAPAAMGLVMIGAAAALAGVFNDTDKLRAVLKVLVYAPIFAALGVGAVAATARLMEDRLGRLDFAASHMTLAVGAFAMMFHLGRGLDAPGFVRFIVGAGLGSALYYGVIWLAFSLKPAVALLLASAHFILGLCFILMIQLVNWLESGGGSGAG